MSHHCHITWPVSIWQQREHLLLWYEHASLWQVWASACCRFLTCHTRLQGIKFFWSVLSVRKSFTQSWLAVFSLLVAAVKRLRSALACRRKDMSRAYILFGRHYLSSHVVKYEPSLLHFCSVHHKQMLRSTVRWHSSHITLQHHKNLQLHLSITVSMVVR